MDVVAVTIPDEETPAGVIGPAFEALLRAPG